MFNIEGNIGYNPSTHDVEEIGHPAQDLNSIYQIVGKSYVKNKDSIQDTIDALDYGEVFFELPNRIPSLQDFINKINEAIG